jgi:hypothetical protein
MVLGQRLAFGTAPALPLAGSGVVDKRLRGAVGLPGPFDRYERTGMHLGVSSNVVYYWIGHRQLEARRGPAGRLCVPFRLEVDRACRERIAHSRHLPLRTQNALQEV